MKKYHVQKYTTENYDLWNEFVAHAKNATFLLHRDFMEYHQDRFEDYSLLLFDETQKLRAIFPANRVGTVLHSHQGLTYGGLVFETNHNLQKVVAVSNYVMDIIDYSNPNITYQRILFNDYSYDFEKGDFLKTKRSELIPKGAISVSLSDKYIYILFLLV